MSQLRHLVTIFKPTSYNLSLDMQRAERTFRGEVTIMGKLLRPGAEIILHAKGLSDIAATIDEQSVQVTAGDFDELILRANNELSAGEHIVQLSFSGTITDPMHGLYPCYFSNEGQQEELLATQFESHHAREVFPCIDEPEAKATFDLTLTTETGVTTLANTPVSSQAEKDGRLVTRFETTPVMSTYLLAWVVGKLGYKEATTKNGVVVRVYATPNQVAHTGFAVDVGAKIIDFYNDYFGIAYPLAKCDMIALPDFSSGAMENWGCITYRETALLVDEKNSSPASRQYVATVIAHELAHQWFGNLVTMRWWNDLWLNESFASWIEYLAVDHLFPEWQMWTQFYDSETTIALDRDGLASVQAVQQSVNNPEEIRTLFDSAIVYAKGASLLHMLHSYVGAEAFRNGLRVYLQRHQYANTDASDLWRALGEVSGKDVGSFMQTWISQPGHPVIKAMFDQDTVELRQQRFFNNPKLANSSPNTLWPVPLLARDVLESELLDTSTKTIKLRAAGRPAVINQGRSGFYPVAYDEAHIAALATAVRENRLSELDRMGLLNDAIDLARAGVTPTTNMLHLLEAYRHETSEPVWGVIAAAFGTLKMFVDENEAQQATLRRFGEQLAADQYQRLGWERKADEPYFDQLLRPLIVGMMCYSENADVLAHAGKLFSQANQPEAIASDVRGSVFAVAAKFGSDQDFEKLLNWLRATESAQVRVQLIAGLTSAKDSGRLEQLISRLTTKDVKLQDVFYWVVYLFRNRYSKKLMWQWLQDNWQWVVDNFGSDMHYTDFPRYSAAAFSTKEGLEAYRAFFEPKLSETGIERDIRQGQEAIETRMLWRERDEQAVFAYLASLQK